MLHGVGWQLMTDVSVQHIGPILKDEAVIIGVFDPRRWVRRIVPKRR